MLRRSIGRCVAARAPGFTRACDSVATPSKPLSCALRRMSRSARDEASSLSISEETNVQSSVQSLLGSIASDLQALEQLHSLFTTEPAFQDAFDSVLEHLLTCHTKNRCVFVTGIGKSGVVAQRLASTLSSISIRSQWTHGAEWSHGELGNIRQGDVVIVLSHSGDTPELASLPEHIQRAGGAVVAVVGREDTRLGRLSDSALIVPAEDRSACPVPSRSIVVQEAISNAIVEALIDSIDELASSFARNHPGGAIGHRLAKQD